MEENKPQPTIDKNIKTIHTYTSDMADAVRENEATVIKIALAEKDKRDREELYKKAEGTTVSKFFLALGGIALIAGAGIGIYFLMKKNAVENAPQQAAPAIQAPISYDDQAFIDLSNAKNATDIRDALTPSLEKAEKSGQIQSLFLTESADGKRELVSLQDFLARIKVTAPAALIRTLGTEYMVGSYTQAAGQGSHLFLILPIKDFNQAYAAMLDWEGSMLTDLFILFGVDVSGNRSALFEKPWKDIILSNKDARILYDQNGTDVLYYIFTDKNNLIITDSRDAIKEITARLLTKTTKPL